MEYLAVRRLLLVTNGTDRSWRGRERIDTLEKRQNRHLLGVRRGIGIRVRVPDHAISVRDRRRVRLPELLLPLRRTIMRITHGPAVVAGNAALVVVPVDRAVEGRLRAADAAPGVGA